MNFHSRHHTIFKPDEPFCISPLKTMPSELRRVPKPVKLFAVQPARVAGQFAVAADDAVAGNHDRHLVLPVGGGNGADGFGLPKRCACSL